MISELESKIRADLAKVDELKQMSDAIHFSKRSNRDSAGIFVYEDEEGYHYSQMSNGAVDMDVVSEHEKLILYHLYSTLTMRVATDKTLFAQGGSDSWQKQVYAKQMELLNVIDPLYKMQRQLEVNDAIQTLDDEDLDDDDDLFDK